MITEVEPIFENHCDREIVIACFWPKKGIVIVTITMFQNILTKKKKLWPEPLRERVRVHWVSPGVCGIK